MRSLCVSLCVASLCLASCSKHPLNYETAMNLLRDRNTDPVKTTFSASPRFATDDPKVVDAYNRLMDGHVLECNDGGSIGMICQPGPAGDAITQSGVSDLTIVAGRWTPSVITKLTQTSRNSATAEIRMAFQASPLFAEYESSFDAIQNQTNSLISLAERKEGKVVRVNYQHYEDGWHLESVD